MPSLQVPVGAAPLRAAGGVPVGAARGRPALARHPRVVVCVRQQDRARPAKRRYPTLAACSDDGLCVLAKARTSCNASLMPVRFDQKQTNSMTVATAT